MTMRPKDCPENSVRNYHCLPRNDPEGSSSHLLRGGRLKLRAAKCYVGKTKIMKTVVQ